MAPDEIHAKVAAWVRGQGFPLEMQVADAFLKAGFFTIQAEYYADPETNTSREIDVVASAQSHYGEWLIRLNIVIECKVAKEKPWVLLTSRSAGIMTPYSQVAQQAATGVGHLLLREAGREELYQNLPLFQLPEHPAYGILQAFSSGNDLAYAASISAAKAAAALISNSNAEDKMMLAEIVIPTVVIDGRLFECHLDESGQLATHEVEEGVLVWRNPIVRMPHTMIRIVTLPRLSTFVSRVSQAAMQIFSEDGLSQFIPSAEAKLDAVRKSQPQWVKP